MISPPINLIRSLLSAAAVVALTACSGGVTVRGHKDVSANFLPIELYVVATGDNELRTIVIGNPFNMPKAAFEKAVLASMAGRNFGPRLNLSTNPKQEDARKRRVVIAFNFSRGIAREVLCAEPANVTVEQQTGGALSVTGVYCAGDQALTQATARAGQVSGIDSGQFQNLMTQLTIVLFPTKNRKTKGGRD